jgi:hypothetical protein
MRRSIADLYRDPLERRPPLPPAIPAKRRRWWVIPAALAIAAAGVSIGTSIGLRQNDDERAARLAAYHHAGSPLREGWRHEPPCDGILRPETAASPPLSAVAAHERERCRRTCAPVRIAISNGLAVVAVVCPGHASHVAGSPRSRDEER